MSTPCLDARSGSPILDEEELPKIAKAGGFAASLKISE
jgi:hypothetical protein